MRICGLQKLTLLDFPGRVACAVFLGGCDFRCPFCHNAALAWGKAEAVMDEQRLLEFLKRRRGLLDGVTVTGGEPLLQPKLLRLLEKIRALGYLIKLDTNGAHPVTLKAVIDADLVDYVAMDIKNSLRRYAETVGLPRLDLAPVLQSAEVLMQGCVDYEFRTTAVSELHDDESFTGIAEWIQGARQYYIQRFEDRDSVFHSGFHTPPRGSSASVAGTGKTPCEICGATGDVKKHVAGAYRRDLKIEKLFWADKINFAKNHNILYFAIDTNTICAVFYR